MEYYFHENIIQRSAMTSKSQQEGMDMRSTTRWKPVPGDTFMDRGRFTLRDVAYHRVLTQWSAKTHGVMGGMEHTSKSTASSIAKTS